MIPEAYKILVKLLVRRTQERKVNWKSTSSEYEFVVYFDDFSLSLSKLYDDEEHSDYAVFVLRSNTGKEIDRFVVSFSDSDWQEISDLFDTARRIALRIDEAISLIVTELKKENSIGKEPEEDLPF